jgi:two-component system response regulator PilR (NtrC family)
MMNGSAHALRADPAAEGYRVETAGSVQEGMAQLQGRNFDVLITDMRLPDGIGMELLLQLRDQSRSERCIVMTAYGSAENAVEALRAGAFDYLTKPVDLRQFRQVVASAVQGIGAVPKPGNPPEATAAQGGSETWRPGGSGWPVSGHATGQTAHCQGRQRHGSRADPG